MSFLSRIMLGGVALMVLVFGLLCLNYTRADGLEHHLESAREYGLPPPSLTILEGGVLSVVLGAGVLGYVIGVGKKNKN